MPFVARVGDTTSHGGSIISGSTKILTNGLATAHIGSGHYCPIHGTNTISSGSTKTTIEGFGVARIGDVTSCGAVIVSGSTNIESS